MNFKPLISAAVLGMLSVASAHAAQTPADIAAAKPDPNGNLIGLKTANGKLVYNFIDLWFNQHKQPEAWDTYVARKGYMNHSVFGANTGTINHTYEEEKAAEARAGGNSHFDIKQIVSQGNLVFVHIAITQAAGGQGAPGGAPPAGADGAMGAGPGGAPQGAGAPPAGGAPQGAPPSGAGPQAAGAMGAEGMGGGGGMSGDGLGPREMVMILRVKDGKVVDHWDLHVATNSNSVVFSELDRKLP
jgi:predicted SnoaL-like aldol condensation-catalyzing enzyme